MILNNEKRNDQFRIFKAIICCYCSLIVGMLVVARSVISSIEDNREQRASVKKK